MNDAKLCEEIRANEDSGFEAFFQIYFKRLFVYLRRRGLSQPDAEQLCTEILTDASLAISAGNFTPLGDNALDRWLFTVARNAFYNFCREGQRQPELLAEFDATANVNDDSNHVQPELKEVVMNAVKALDERDQILLSLRVLDAGSSFAEIGERLDMTAGAARVRFHRLIKKLRSSLQGHAEVRRSLGLVNSDEEAGNA